jgi:hypothetical protein
MDTTIDQENVLRDLFNELVVTQGFSTSEENELFEKIESTIILTVAAELFTTLDEEARANIDENAFSDYKAMFAYLSAHTPKEYFSEVVAAVTESVLAEFLHNLK